jgi:hypothetical protein
MWEKPSLIGLAVLACGLASAPRSNAGTEVIDGYGTPAPRYNYAPPPPVYYVPPPVRVVVYPTVRYYAAPVRVYNYQRFHGRRGYCAPRHW